MNSADRILENISHIKLILEEGFVPHRNSFSPEFISHYAHPIEVTETIWNKNYEILDVLGLEGLVSRLVEVVNKLSGTAWEAWVDLNYRVAANKGSHGCVEHHLVIADKPGWREVLSKIYKTMMKRC